MTEAAQGWPTAGEIPKIGAGEVHVWRAELQNHPELERSLCPEERARADRFFFEKDRQRFIAGRGLLRGILGAYLGMAPSELRFTTSAAGKPELDSPAEQSLRFNLSHSAELMLLAVSRVGEVGIDLEFMRGDVNFESLAEHHFAPEETSHLRLLSPPDRTAKFYEIWTATEAQLKASGVGLSNGTKVVEPDRWSLHKLRPATGYAGALAVEGEDVQLKFWSWRK